MRKKKKNWRKVMKVWNKEISLKSKPPVTISPNMGAAENFYFKIMDEKVIFDQNFTLQLSINAPEGRKMVDVCALSNLRLPNIRRIWIDNLIDQDQRFDKFLNWWTPVKLSLLWLIFGSYFWEEELAKAKFYYDGFTKSFLNVTQEIYLRHMQIDSDDLANIGRGLGNNLHFIVTSSRNCERLLIHYCKIHTTSDLDFNHE